MRLFIFVFLSLLSSSIAYADAREWRIAVTCDANEREARVEMFDCDANATDETGCETQKTNLSDDIRVVTAGAEATSYLYTPVRIAPEHVGLRSNHPAEFSCSMPYGEPNKNEHEKIEYQPIFLRIERYPTTFHSGGRCGAARYQAMLSIQMGTANLDLTKPIEKIEMAGDCGWGDPGPISKVVINADTGEISTTPYSTE